MVYFIQRQTDNAIKIGCTRNVLKRIKHYKNVKILKHIKGSFKIEKEIHKKFQHLHIEGEWFVNNQDLINYIESLENCIVNSDIESEDNLHHFLKNITNSIISTRKSKSISISKLSELSNVPVASLYKIERNEYDISFYNILKILDSLNLLNFISELEQKSKLISNVQNKTYNSIKIDAEYQLVLNTLGTFLYNKKKTAEYLNISTTRLNSILKKHKIELEESDLSFNEKTKQIKLQNIIEILKNNSFNKYKTAKILEITIKKLDYYINTISDKELKRNIKQNTL